MKKYILAATLLFVSAQANAGEMLGYMDTLSKNKLMALAENVYAKKDWNNVFHERIYEYSDVADFEPRRIYYNEEGVYVHIQTIKGVETGYFVAPVDNFKGKRYSVEYKKVSGRIYEYRIEPYSDK